MKIWNMLQACSKPGGRDEKVMKHKNKSEWLILQGTVVVIINQIVNPTKNQDKILLVKNA